ncbi:MAG: HNH endonuclease [Bdellovibrionales bacterium]|nr:HNH endonuclease [Bdellovibrionales bacterium]
MLNIEVQNKKQCFQSKEINIEERSCLKLKNLSNQKLLSQTKLLAQKERNITIQVIRHLSEIEFRKLHLKRGFSSLFDYTVKELGYSEGSAYRRIKAMKLCREVPETTAKLETGSLNLTTASQLQTFFEKQNKKVIKIQSDLNVKHIKHQINFETQALENRVLPSTTTECGVSQLKDKSLGQSELQRSDSSPRRIVASYLDDKNQKLNLLEKVEGKSSRQTERLLCEVDPEISIPKEKLRFIGNGKTELKIIMDEGLKKKRKSGQTNQTIQKVQTKNNQQSKITSTAISKQSRYIPAEIRRFIWTRDHAECSYVCPETRKKCSSKHLLQIDHIQPYSLGGSSKPDNLRLLCAGHNQYRNNNL